jgi:ATP-dependent Lon protease
MAVNRAKEDLSGTTQTYPILPLRNSVLFPQVVIPLAVGRRKSIRLIQEALASESSIAIVTQREPETDDPTQTDLFAIGTSAVILKVVKISDDNFSVIVQGQNRIRLSRITGTEPYLRGEFEIIREPEDRDVEIEALFRNLKNTAKQVVRYIPEMPNEAGQMVEGVPNPDSWPTSSQPTWTSRPTTSSRSSRASRSRNGCA